MLKIREAFRTDADFIIDFQICMAFETEGMKLQKAIVAKGVNSVLADTNKGKYYIAEKAGKVVASLLSLYEWSDWRNGNVIWIHSVFVLPKHRKSGIFKTMYNHIKQIVENDETLKGIRLFVDKTNTNAQKVYKSLGMNDEHYKLFEWMSSE